MDHLIWYPGYDVVLPNVVRAENCHLVDADGHRYVDLESGVWCTSIGHGHPRVLTVLNAQAARIAHTGFSFSNPIVEDAAQTVLALHGFNGGRCVFLCSGSEAVEYGVRAAQSVNDRPMLMTMADSYFGAYGSASIRRSEEWFDFDWTGCTDCDRGGDCDASCEAWAAIPFAKIGGFLFEPGSSSGLVRFPPENLIRSIAAAIQTGGGLVMVNEVTTGMGRTGKWFGYQHYDIRPDIVAMGKGIGNGYPVSAAAFSKLMIARLAGSGFKYAQSHQNDPLGAAVALEVIRVIDEGNLIERGQRIGAALVRGLERVMARSSHIREVRHRGLMVALVLDDDASAAYTAHVWHALVREGFVLAQRPGLNVLRIDPSLTIDRRDIDSFLEALERVLTTGPPDGLTAASRRV